MTPSGYEPSLPHVPLVSPTKPLVTLGAPQMSPLQPEPYTPQGQSHRKTRGPVICHCLSAALEMGEATWHPEQRGQLSAVSGQHGLREKTQRNHRVYDGVERMNSLLSALLLLSWTVPPSVICVAFLPFTPPLPVSHVCRSSLPALSECGRLPRGLPRSSSDRSCVHSSELQSGHGAF